MKKTKSVVPVAKIKNNLRRIHMHCKYKQKAKQRCKIDAALFLCEEEGCKVAHYEGSSDKNFRKLSMKHGADYEVVREKIEMDHILPVVDVKAGFQDWHIYIHALWVDDTGYKGLCRNHHAEKSAKEAAERAEHGSLKRKKK